MILQNPGYLRALRYILAPGKGPKTQRICGSIGVKGASEFDPK